MFTVSVVVALILGLGGLWYCYLVVAGKVRPVFAAWIIMTTMLSASFVSYWYSPKHSVQGNIAHLVSVFSTLAITSTILINGWWKGTLRFAFSALQRNCLLAAACIGFLWYVSANATIANVLMQGVMVIGYTPLVVKLWKTKPGDADGESLVTWSGVAIGSGVGMFNALATHEPLAVVYVVRGVATAGLTVFLIGKIRFQNSRRRDASP